MTLFFFFTLLYVDQPVNATQFLMTFRGESGETFNYLERSKQFSEPSLNEFYDFELYFTFVRGMKNYLQSH